MTYTAKQLRDYYKSDSNNSENNNKNICALEVAKALGVAHQVRYLHTITDLVRAARTRYTVRSRMSKVKGKSVGGARKTLAKVSATDTVGTTIGYIIRVDGHVILTLPDGTTHTDTDPRQRDARRITHCYAVYDTLADQRARTY